MEKQGCIWLWLKSRMIPRNRAFVKEILMSQGLNENDLEESLKICMALSVNDIYCRRRLSWTL